MDTTATVREALRPLGHGTDPAALTEIERDQDVADRAAPAPPAAAPSLFDALEPPAAQADRDARLRQRVGYRQSVEWRLGRLLATMRQHGLHRALGFATLEAWAAAVPGLPVERVEALLRLDALLRPLPATEDAFRRGRITLRQAMLIAQASAGPVPDARREREWLRRALTTAADRLEALVRAQSAAGVAGAPRGITSGTPESGSRKTATAVS
jgi:hypothetical protein